MKKVAIMQPTFIPWPGYFGLMQYVDTFILLDNVQFAKRSWQQRNKIKTQHGEKWLTVPVISKGKQSQLINQVEIDRSSNFNVKAKKIIEHSYVKSENYAKYAPDIIEQIMNPNIMLSEYTTQIIHHFKDLMGINTTILQASKLHCEERKSICLHLCGLLMLQNMFHPRIKNLQNHPICSSRKI